MAVLYPLIGVAVGRCEGRCAGRLVCTETPAGMKQGGASFTFGYAFFAAGGLDCKSIGQLLKFGVVYSVVACARQRPMYQGAAGNRVLRMRFP